jgi:hypothetical protein
MKGRPGMKKPSARIREEIVRLQEQLKQAETREAERIGRVALKAGLGDMEIEESDLQTAFEGLVKRFCGTRPASTEKDKGRASRTPQSASNRAGADQVSTGED